MKTLLRIDASTRNQQSTSKRLGDTFEQLWRQNHPQGRVVARDLASKPVPHLSSTQVNAFMQADVTTSADTALSDRLITELKAADELLICSPMYNFTLPSSLKAYIDHIVRSGHTFGFQEYTPLGLLSDKTATIITSRGGLSASSGGNDPQALYLQDILGFIGITTQQVISLEGTALPDDTRQPHFDQAMSEVRHRFNTAEPSIA